jgi:hypothetical protein
MARNPVTKQGAFLRHPGGCHHGGGDYLDQVNRSHHVPLPADCIAGCQRRHGGLGVKRRCDGSRQRSYAKQVGVGAIGGVSLPR